MMTIRAIILSSAFCIFSSSDRSDVQRLRLTVAVEFRQCLDPLPSLASAHWLDTDLIEILVKHGGTLFCERRRAVIFFLPYRNPVRLGTSFFQRMRQSIAERAQPDK